MKKVFLCGIAGTGMSALAGLFKKKGYAVYGSDSRFYPPVDGLLKKLRITLAEGFAAGNIPADVDFCVIGNVVGRGNPEVEFILDRSIEYYSMAEALQRFFIKGKESLVVAGSHGKTTTASFIAHLLTVAGRQPGFFIGGILQAITNWGAVTVLSPKAMSMKRLFLTARPNFSSTGPTGWSSRLWNTTILIFIRARQPT
jgi:UDP-N-acetylmuramate: L-alanyl-gamma-D-glutamyl-meso-diaminopimelate ligase